MTDTLERSQKEICERYGVSYYPSPPDMKMGISLNVREGITPINGLRHPPEGDTTGWYIWAGEALPGDPEFFKPVQVKHLPDWCPVVQKYLGLPPGWQFLVAGNYEDVWYDESLLNI